MKRNVLFLQLVQLVRGSTLVPMPAIANVLPCTDTVANCAIALYQIQTTDAANLVNEVNLSNTMDGFAGDLLTTVQNLLSSSVTLNDTIDPDNSRTNGGQVLQLSAGRQINGITPFMGTLAAKIVADVAQKNTDLSTLATTLKNGMSNVVRLITASTQQVGAQLGTVSVATQQSINTASAALRDLLVQTDAKLVTSSNQFLAAQSSGPTALMTSLGQAMSLELNDYLNIRAKLSDFYNQVADLPSNLLSYQTTVLGQISAYQASQNAVSATTAAVNTAAFAANVAATAADDWLQMQGISTTDHSQPYYSKSVQVMGDANAAKLNDAMVAANITEQTNLAALRDSITSTSNGISLSYLPVLNDFTGKVSGVSQADSNFVADATGAFMDGNNTISQGQTSWNSFTNDMNNLFNLTGGILTGQTTAITSSLLTQIGNMSQQAGVQMNEMDALVLQASQGELDADAVRRAILANSNNHVVVTIGNNDAAMNASLATISNFMNKSSDQVKYILNVIQYLSGDQVVNLNATATAAIQNVTSLINSTRSGANQLINSLISGAATDIAADRVGLNTTYLGLNVTGQKAINATQQLLNAMKVANDADLYTNMGGKVNRSVAILNAGLTTTSLLTSDVKATSQQAVDRQRIITAFQNALLSATSARTDAILANVTALTAAGGNTVHAAAASLGVKESNLLAFLSANFNNITANYSRTVAGIQNVLNSMVVWLNTNNTIYGSRIADASADLATSMSAALSSERSIGNNFKADGLANVNGTLNAIDAYIEAAQARVQSNLTAQINAQTSRAVGAIQLYAGLVPALAHNVSVLASTVSALHPPPSNMLAQATDLMNEFRSQLETLRDSIASFSSSSADEFSTSLAATVSGVKALVTNLDSAISAAANATDVKLHDGIVTMNNLVNSVSVTNFSSQTTELINKTNSNLAQIVQTADLQMNASAHSWTQSLLAAQASIFSNLNNTAALQNRVSSLGSQVGSTTVNGNENVTASLVSALSNQTAAAIDQLMAASRTALTQAQQAQVLRQLTTANIGLSSAGKGTALASAVAAAISSVNSVAGAATANNDYVSSQVAALANAANYTVQLSSSDIEAIIAKVEDDSTATRAALDAQLAAAGKAQASVGDAENIWSALKASALTLSSDELDNLVALKTDVFNTSDALITDARLAAQTQISALEAGQTVTQTQAAGLHANYATQLSNAEDALSSVALNVANEKTEMTASLNNLRGLADRMTIALNQRLSQIVAQTGPFRAAINAAAATDISQLTQ